MTEKRYELTYFDCFYITDHLTNDSKYGKDYATVLEEDLEKVVEILNEQDQQIKKTKEVLQKHYDYAHNQRQKNLENAIVAKAYDVLRYTVDEIAEELGIALKK